MKTQQKTQFEDLLTTDLGWISTVIRLASVAVLTYATFRWVEVGDNPAPWYLIAIYLVVLTLRR